MLRLDPVSLDSPPPPCGFAWWYADLVGANGDGAVVVWSLGLPFFPWSEQAGPGSAVDRPALAISTYRSGREQFYSLSAARPGDAEWDPGRGRFRIGASVFQIDFEGGRAMLRGTLDASVPGTGRVVGHLELHGVPCRIERPDGVGAPHAWAPRALGEGSLALTIDGAPDIVVGGRGYLDSNRSAVPLSALGMTEWRWARVALPRGELVHYEVRGLDGARRSLALEVDERGIARVLEGVDVELDRGAPTMCGLRRARTMRLTHEGRWLASLRFPALVDDGPFYQRYLVEASAPSGPGRGFAELVVPPRVGVPWQAPLVSMRAHRVGERGSRWLPLFSGPRSGRWRRLAAALRREVGA